MSEATNTARPAPPSLRGEPDEGGAVDFKKEHEKFIKSLNDVQDPTLKIVFSKFEETTGQKREFLLYGVGGILALYLVAGSAAQLVCNCIGAGYPAYRSIKAVKSTDKEDDTLWLTYWCVFGVFSCFDFFSDAICGFFPIYWLVKVIFLLYLSLPQTNGAIKLYRKYVEPMHKKIEEFLGNKQ
uniref:Receptor expression-enhancing protein n=1 Tax=Strongyloides venezuelensis TaxID=75913 RepID=A0A0K0FAN6_STRVS